MEHIFLSLLKVSVTTGILIAVVLLFSTLINKHFIAKWKYWVWLLLAVRLLIPFNPTISSAPVQIPIPQQVYGPVSMTPRSAALAPQIVQAAPVMPNPDPAAIFHELTILETLSIVWVIGIMAFFLWQMITYLRCKHQIVRWGRAAGNRRLLTVFDQLCAEMGIHTNITLLVNQHVSSPMMIGFFKSYLILPGEDYSDSDLVYILRHELVHFKRHDLLYKLLVLAANAVHWFNPAVYLLLREAGKDLEIACDEEVIRGLSSEARREYSDAIFRTIHKTYSANTVLSTSFDGGTKTIKERFRHILGESKKRKGILFGTVLLICAATAGSLIALNSPRAISPDEYDALEQEHMSPLLVSMILIQNWEDANEIDPSNFIYYFAAALHDAGIDFTLDDEGYIPAEELEPYVHNRFDVTKEHLHSGMYYSAEKNAYEFGGLGSTAYSTVTGASQKGNLLTIGYDIIGPMEYRVAYGTLEIEKNAEEYKYRSNQLEWSAQYYLDYPNSTDTTDQNGILTMSSGSGITSGNPELGIHEYTGNNLSDIVYYYENEALPKLDAVGAADPIKYEDGWYWSGTYRGGKPLTIDVQREFGLDTYIITAAYEASAAAPNHDKLNAVKSNEDSPSTSHGADEFDEADMYDWFYVPSMDDEQKGYYDIYITPLIYNGMLMLNWSDTEYANISIAPNGASQSNNLIMAYEDIVGQDVMQKLWKEHDENLPAEDVESVLLERFPFTKEQLHEIMYSCYNEATKTYTYGGGRGGGPIEAAITRVEEDGEFVQLSYEVFTGYSGLDQAPASYLYKTSGTLTLKKGTDPYRYWAVRVEEEIEAEAKRDVALRDQ